MSLTKIAVEDLKIGQYVADLDRPWIETPFLFQGFHIESGADLAELRTHCRYVVVDGKKSRVEVQPTQPAPPRAFDAELSTAEKVHAELSNVLEDLLAAANAEAGLNAYTARAAVAPVVASLERCPDALLWMLALKAGRAPLYQHAMNCAVWAALVGQSMNLNRLTCERLALSGLVFDLGRTKLPADLIRRPPQNRMERRAVERHVDYSMDILAGAPGIDGQVTLAVSAHHERVDGRGYPSGLSQDQIPLAAAILAVADYYTYLIRPHHPAAAPAAPAAPIKAMERLHAERGRRFAPSVVDAFVQAAGVYPTGSLVELDSGELAFVVEQHPAARLRPVLRIIARTDRQRLPVPERRDLQLARERPGYRITKGLARGSYGFDLAS
jgi:HD-GYP domain-containing protein (c-di-GMP phosphodiesterase class II)